MRRRWVVGAGWATVAGVVVWYAAKRVRAPLTTTAHEGGDPPLQHPPVSEAPTRPRSRRGPCLRSVRRALVAACVAVLAMTWVTGPSFAYFAVGGLGAAPGATGSLQPLVIQPATTGSPSSSLLPGSTAHLLLNVTNPNPGSVTILSVVQGGGVSVTGGSGCTGDPGWPGSLGNSGVSVVSSTGLGIPVAGGATVVVQIPGGAAMSTASAAGCQGATFQIPVTVVVSQ